MEQIRAPFTDEQVEALNKWQNAGYVPDFTCCGEYCTRSEENNEGKLIATPDGWVCPCGQYTQDWANASMLHLDKVEKYWERFK